VIALLCPQIGEARIDVKPKSNEKMWTGEEHFFERKQLIPGQALHERLSIKSGRAYCTKPTKCSVTRHSALRTEHFLGFVTVALSLEQGDKLSKKGNSHPGVPLRG